MRPIRSWALAWELSSEMSLWQVTDLQEQLQKDSPKGSPRNSHSYLAPDPISQTNTTNTSNYSSDEPTHAGSSISQQSIKMGNWLNLSISQQSIKMGEFSCCSSALTGKPILIYATWGLMVLIHFLQIARQIKLIWELVQSRDSCIDKRSMFHSTGIVILAKASSFSW